MLGVGERDWSLGGHLELSESMRGRRLAEEIGSSRRAMAWTVGRDERDARVVRM